jgi:Tol biopolymer transport system component
MAIPIGTQLGSHEITAWLGKGGMGEVYRARDTRLKREVAIKILPDEFSRDADRVSRFQREAEVLASLNHPNIAHIYGVEESGSVRGIVMELVDGETLQEQLRRGPIHIDEALPMAKQIAGALEAAHEKGIIHRDLKPANIKLTTDGQIKVLDFGLAKAFQDQQAASFSNSPTVMSASVPGVIIGTAAYMSPEQAKGKPADRASDVWAFGCVLFEMLTARAAFAGETISEIFAGVLKEEPDWALLPSNTPAPIRRLLRRCLEKDRRERLQHMGDARLEISEATSAAVSGIEPAGKAAGSRLWIAAVVAAIFIGAALGWLLAPKSVPISQEVRFEFTTPPTPDPVSLAVSPDGQQIVFVATLENRQQLWLRSLNSTSNRPLPGTERGFFPFWSPDSRSLGFFGDGKLKRIDIDGGLVRVLANAPNPLGGAWNRDGTILFTPNYTGPLFRISAAGGEAVPQTHVDVKQAGHRFPHFLPDGRHFLFYVPSSEEVRGVYLGQLDSGTTQRLLDSDAPAVYASTGHLLFIREGRLIGQAFDPAKGALSGNPSPIADQLVAVGDTHAAGLSASAAGPIAYRGGAGGGLQRQFVWFDRSGKEISRVGSLDDGNPLDPSVSPDGRRLAMERTVNANSDVWILDLARGLQSRFTFDMSTEADPIWSPDGKRIAFGSNRSGVFDIYLKPTAGAGAEELLLATQQNKAPVDWSRDGRFVLFRSPAAATGFDLWALPMEGERKPFPVVQTNFEERDGQFSPDVKWIAYQSNESGRTEILVQAFPGPGGKLQVSTNGGAQVRWRPDGKELFYIALDGQLMGVPIQFSGNPQSAEVGTPFPLFVTHTGGAIQAVNTTSYIVSPDGRQFLMDTIVNESTTSPVTVILNWKPKP